MHRIALEPLLMSDSKQLCFTLSADEFRSLQFYAQSEGHSSESFARHIIKERLHTYLLSDAKHNDDRRTAPRVQVSIPAVSLVNFPDNTSRSYPVTIRDISKDGMRIAFPEIDSSIYQQLQKATDFEIVFTVPKTATTIAFSCNVCRVSCSDSVQFAGKFDPDSAGGVRMLDNLFN